MDQDASDQRLPGSYQRTLTGQQARLLGDQLTCRLTHSNFKRANEIDAVHEPRIADTQSRLEQLLCMTTVAHVQIGQFTTHSKFNRGCITRYGKPTC
ncbi:MAG: hypothetical protein VB142_11985 [Burkholderia sp.]